MHHSGLQCMVAVAASVEKPWSMLSGGPFVCFLSQTGIDAPFSLYGLHFVSFRQILVRRRSSGWTALIIKHLLING